MHELDYAIWGLGVDSQPNSVSSTGGIYYFKDDREWPDTMQVSLEYPGKGDQKIFFGLSSGKTCSHGLPPWVIVTEGFESPSNIVCESTSIKCHMESSVG